MITVQELINRINRFIWVKAKKISDEAGRRCIKILRKHGFFETK